MKRVFSILIFAFFCVTAFAQNAEPKTKNYKDTTAAHEAGCYESIVSLKENCPNRYKIYKINSLTKGSFKISDNSTTNDWYMLDSVKSDYGMEIDSGFDEDHIQGYEYDTIVVSGHLDEPYVLYKKKSSEWNMWLDKPGWKATKKEAGKDCIEIKVKKSDGKEYSLYGKLDEISETKDLVKEGYSPTRPSSIKDTTIKVSNIQITFYKEQTVPDKQKNEIFKHVKTGIVIIIIVAIILLISVVIVLLFFMKKMKSLIHQLQPKVDPKILPTPQLTQPVNSPQPTTLPPPTSPSSTENIAFAQDADEWIIVGASITGNGHIATKMPCQDSHKYEYLGEGWGIAVISDGAGSATNAHIGSKMVVQRAVEHFKNLIIGRNWIKKNELPSEIEWSQIAFATLKTVRDDMEQFAKIKNLELKSLSATAIIVIHTPNGILATHIGDGRAGYKNEKGEWKSLITPHKGEEANHTIFVPSDFWEIPAYKMSDVLVPESVVIKEKPFGFTLMSDGCESTSWLCNQQDEKTGKFFDPNKPYPNFFNPLDKNLQSFRNDKINEQEIADKWKKFIESGNPSFVKEIDDKTMILGVIYM